MGAAGVVKVLASGKKFYALGSCLREDIEKTGMQTAAQEYVCRDGLKHESTWI
jgi:hypothetical protein